MSIKINDINKQKTLINIFVNSVYLYDDYCIIIINMSNISLNNENIPLNQIKVDLKGKNNGSCSTTIKQGPQNPNLSLIKAFFILKY